MNPPTRGHERPGRFHGLWQILRFNWPQYLAAAAFILGLAGWLASGWGPAALRVVGFAGICLAAYWILASLAASHWIYDRSNLYRWTWIAGALPQAPRAWLNLHAGLDESSVALRRLFPESEGVTADFFDPAEMSEPSITRARNGSPVEPVSRRVDFRALPFRDGSFDTTFVLFAAHELRRVSSRAQFFRELHRVLRPDGCLLLVEHARDAANFAAFGPGWLHFLPPREWRRLAGLTAFRLESERWMTPFVRVFTLRRTP